MHRRAGLISPLYIHRENLQSNDMLASKLLAQDTCQNSTSMKDMRYYNMHRGYMLLGRLFFPDLLSIEFAHYFLAEDFCFGAMVLLKHIAHKNE